MPRRACSAVPALLHQSCSCRLGARRPGKSMFRGSLIHSQPSPVARLSAHVVQLLRGLQVLFRCRGCGSPAYNPPAQYATMVSWLGDTLCNISEHRAAKRRCPHTPQILWSSFTDICLILEHRSAMKYHIIQAKLRPYSDTSRDGRLSLEPLEAARSTLTSRPFSVSQQGDVHQMFRRTNDSIAGYKHTSITAETSCSSTLRPRTPFITGIKHRQREAYRGFSVP
ncbi:hypothetical protein FB567DRAFT_74095 [Paraphoma chrysanthemicola]|uniref:Uncharacterized protein n=1 Tax=Paraphoma chrysanthemicola TaxID=798071 RepID=A0A8K0VXE2_9PLEO|nr:hypothetical protein FB567DRAFT_74095 [Paraphoma chrysanthemicola]